MNFAEALIVMGPLLGQMTDLASTEAAIQRGLVETHQAQWMQSTNTRRAVKVGVGAGMSLVLVELKRKGVSKKVRILTSVAFAATGFVPAGINISRTW